MKYLMLAAGGLSSLILGWQSISYYSLIPNLPNSLSFSLPFSDFLSPYYFIPVRDLTSSPKGFYKLVSAHAPSSPSTIRATLYLDLYKGIKQEGEIQVDWATPSGWHNLTLDREGKIVYSSPPMLTDPAEGIICYQSLDNLGYFANLPALNKDDQFSGNYLLSLCHR